MNRVEDLKQSIELNWYEVKHKYNNYIVIKDIDQLFERAQKVMNNKPVLGANRWFLEDYFCVDNLIALKMEDGHTENYAILEYNSKSKKITILFESNISNGGMSL